jgi:GH18 family chitinase
MKAYVTYDVSSHGQKKVKDAMKDLGYFDNWTSNQKTYYLPNTCLWKKDTSTTQALADIEGVIKKLNLSIPLMKDKIRLERCIVTLCDSWSGIEGDPHKE